VADLLPLNFSSLFESWRWHKVGAGFLRAASLTNALTTQAGYRTLTLCLRRAAAEATRNP
jgi:hypothetical protein